MLPRRWAPALFALLLSGAMSLLVSGISTLRALGAVPGLAETWMHAWLAAWTAAFPVALAVAPLVRRVVDRLVAPD